jgi:hypothetical protein
LLTHSARQGPSPLEEIPFGGEFPDHPTEFLHGVHEDARLELSAIAALADRLPQSVVHDIAAQPLLVPEGGPPKGALGRPGDVIRNLGEADAWLTLLHVEDDPEYADLMNSTLDRLEPGMLGSEGKMRDRAAFIIVSSPNSVTPAHFDIEQSLLMQVGGSKILSVGRFETEAMRRYEAERYWDGSHGRVESMPEEMLSFSLAPGRGVYIPQLVPHWVHNGPNISITVTFTYFTNATMRKNRIENLNSRLRRFHLSPRPPGQSAPIDAVKTAAIGAFGLARNLRSGIAGAATRGGHRRQS